MHCEQNVFLNLRRRKTRVWGQKMIQLAIYTALGIILKNIILYLLNYIKNIHAFVSVDS